MTTLMDILKARQAGINPGTMPGVTTMPQYGTMPPPSVVPMSPPNPTMRPNPLASTPWYQQRLEQLRASLIQGQKPSYTGDNIGRVVPGNQPNARDRGTVERGGPVPGRYGIADILRGEGRGGGYADFSPNEHYNMAKATAARFGQQPLIGQPQHIGGFADGGTAQMTPGAALNNIRMGISPWQRANMFSTVKQGIEGNVSALGADPVDFWQNYDQGLPGGVDPSKNIASNFETGGKIMFKHTPDGAIHFSRG